jgi:hypothetical protein
MGGHGASMPDVMEILAEITSDEKKLGRKYSVEDLIASTIKVLSKTWAIHESTKQTLPRVKNP